MNIRFVITTTVLIFLCSIVFGQGGITTNFGFDVKANVPADLRETIETDADTANVDFKYPAMRVRSEATNNLFEYTGTKWISAGRTYSVATAAGLADLPERTGWAYVEDENAWYYWDGGAWVEDIVAPSELAQEGANLNDALRWNGSQYAPAPVNTFEFVDTTLTLTVCNNLDTCNYGNFQSALQAATRVKAVYDTLNANTKILIVQRPNPDGAPMVWNVDTSTLVVQGGDYSGIFISSRWRDSTYNLLAPNAVLSFLTLQNTSNFGIENLRATNTSGVSRGALRVIDCNSTIIKGLELDSFANAINIFRGTAFLTACTAKNSLVSRGIWNQNGYITITSSSFFNNNIGIANRGYIVTRKTNTYNNNTNLANQGGHFVAGDDLFNLDTNTTPTNITSSFGAIFSSPPASMTKETVNIPLNTSTGDGIIYNSTAPYPFQESATAAEPSASSGIRYYYNTDEQETKVSVNDQWEYLDKPDTLVYTFPLLEYAGNAADTIASGATYYFSPITQAMSNRKIAKLEISTTKEVDQDWGFWLWSEDIENATNTIVLPIAPATFFTIPANTKNISWDGSDAEIPPAGKDGLTLGDMLFVELMNGAVDGAGGLEDYEATEGANGLYLTLYFVK